MTIREAKEILTSGITGDHLHCDKCRAAGFLEAVNKMESSIQALKYCSIEPGYLFPENNKQHVVAMNALAEFKQNVLGEE